MNTSTDSELPPPTAHAAQPGSAPHRLADWIPLEQLPKEFPEKVPHLNAALWLVRIHRGEMVAAQAVLRIGRKLFIHPERFEAALIEAGVKAVARATAEA